MPVTMKPCRSCKPGAVRPSCVCCLGSGEEPLYAPPDPSFTHRDNPQPTWIGGFSPVAHFPPGVTVVGLTTFRDRLFVALSTSVYELVDGELVPLKFKQLPEETAP